MMHTNYMACLQYVYGIQKTYWRRWWRRVIFCEVVLEVVILKCSTHPSPYQNNASLTGRDRKENMSYDSLRKPSAVVVRN